MINGNNLTSINVNLQAEGALERVPVELCGIECIDLIKHLVKMLVISFSYTKKIENEKSFFRHIKKIQNVLKVE